MTAELTGLVSHPVVGAQIEARAQHPELANRAFLYEAERTWTYGEFCDASVRTANFLRRRLGAKRRRSQSRRHVLPWPWCLVGS